MSSLGSGPVRERKIKKPPPPGEKGRWFCCGQGEGSADAKAEISLAGGHGHFANDGVSIVGPILKIGRMLKPELEADLTVFASGHDLRSRAAIEQLLEGRAGSEFGILEDQEVGASFLKKVFFRVAQVLAGL